MQIIRQYFSFLVRALLRAVGYVLAFVALVTIVPVLGVALGIPAWALSRFRIGQRLLDGLFNGVIWLAGVIPFVRKPVNRLLINQLSGASRARPHPFNLWSPHKEQPDPKDLPEYSTWPGLVDKRYTAIHLPLASIETRYPDLDKVGALFKRDGEGEPEGRSTVLFTFFAQWFTDSFLRTNPLDYRKNTSNHEIDLCQIYGLRESTARVLRSMEGGKLRSQLIKGEEFPPFLFEAPGKYAYQFGELPYVGVLPGIYKNLDADKRERTFLFAGGLERANTTIGYSAYNTLFLREHNRVCDELARAYPSWDDERLFQTARMILIVQLLKIVVEDYIRHISGVSFPLSVDTSFAEEQIWYRSNWITAEFDLLYRWHSMIPNTVRINGEDLTPTKFMLNNEPLTELGLGRVIDDMAKQSARKAGLFNTPDFLLPAERAAVEQGRQSRLRSFNEYRVAFGQKPLKSFQELTSNERVQQRLQELYGDIDQLEFFVGLFGQDAQGNRLHGELLTSMVALDAFSQALTNPLLSRNLFHEGTFSDVGMEIIANTSTLEDLFRRNVRDAERYKATFDL